MTLEPCARCGERPALEGKVLCAGCDEQGPLSPVEARRHRSRMLDDDPAGDLVPGETYPLRTTDGANYEDAEFISRDDDGILWFHVFGGMAKVGVAAHEYAGTE